MLTHKTTSGFQNTRPCSVLFLLSFSSLVLSCLQAFRLSLSVDQRNRLHRDGFCWVKRKHPCTR